MEYDTSQLCDTYADLVDVIDPIFSNYGGRHSFAGKVVTIKCFEGTGLIEKIVEADGTSKVLVIDGEAHLIRRRETMEDLLGTQVEVDVLRSAVLQ